jgi:hypothetical protein
LLGGQKRRALLDLGFRELAGVVMRLIEVSVTARTTASATALPVTIVGSIIELQRSISLVESRVS